MKHIFFIPLFTSFTTLLAEFLKEKTAEPFDAQTSEFPLSKLQWDPVDVGFDGLSSKNKIHVYSQRF
jgi:hypothetical protein